MFVFSDLPPKSPTVCYSTTDASMRNTTSLPWKSSMSRYSSPSLQVQCLFVLYQYDLLHLFSFMPFFPWVYCSRSPLSNFFPRWDQNHSFPVHPRRSQRRPVARGGGALLQQGNQQRAAPQTTRVCTAWLMIRVFICCSFLHIADE